MTSRRFRPHVVEAGGLGIESREFRLVDLRQPGIERFPGEDGFILRRLLIGSWLRPVAGFLIEPAQQRTQFEVAVKLAQRIGVCLACVEIVDADVQLDIRLDGREVLRQAQVLDVVAQAFADLALDLFAVLDNAVGTVVKVEPLGGRLGPDFRYAGNVVRAVADEREVVDDLFRVDVKLGS